jgi:hypothetical protein
VDDEARLGFRQRALENRPSDTGELPEYLKVGNRFASAGLACGVFGLAAALLAFPPAIGWMTAITSMLLAAVGFVKYCKRSATNRDAAILGAFLSWLSLVLLLTQAAVALHVPIMPG